MSGRGEFIHDGKRLGVKSFLTGDEVTSERRKGWRLGWHGEKERDGAGQTKEERRGESRPRHERTQQ